MLSNFITSCINGDVLAIEIDDFVKAWNEYDTNLELYQYLGFTEEEYDAWLVDATLVNVIIAARIEKISFQEKLANLETNKIAARGEIGNPDKLKTWLISEGIIVE